MRSSYEKFLDNSTRNSAESIINIMEAGKPSLDAFQDAPGYTPRRIAINNSYVEKRKSTMAETSRRNYHAKALEAIVQTGVEQGAILSVPDVETYPIPSTDFDDIANGIDFAIECKITDENNEKHSIPLAIDCTTRINPQEIRDKILHLHTNRNSGETYRPKREDGLPNGFVPMDYFYNQYTDEKYSIPMLPRYTLGVSRDSVEGQVERIYETDKGAPRIPSDSITNLKILLEMRAQNELFITLATRGDLDPDDPDSDLTPDELFALRQLEDINSIFDKNISAILKTSNNPYIQKNLSSLSRSKIIKELSEQDQTFKTLMETVSSIHESAYEVAEELEDDPNAQYKSLGHHTVKIAKNTKLAA